VVSASHNPFEDNGIKFFAADGFKLPDEIEHRIEAEMDKPLVCVPPASLGKAGRFGDAAKRYVEFCKTGLETGESLRGLRVVVDSANGAAYQIAPRVFEELGASVISIADHPDGFNINAGCGSTHPQWMQRTVRERGADLGIALDGDADRVVLADEKGQIVDGDQILALIARSWNQAGTLKGGGIVATVMSNLALERYVRAMGLSLERTAVGDRYVVEHMRDKGFNIGGEQSGHVVLNDFSTTGDGLIAALQVLAVIAQTGQKASEAAHLFDPLPQLLKNVRFRAGQKPLENQDVATAIKDGEARLVGKGRLLIRKSGTEPLIRVMAEGDDEKLVTTVVGDIVKVLEKACVA
jgi:phosphoglucosamine mutase